MHSAGGEPGGPKIVGRDVGSFYPSTNNAALTVWNHVMQVGPAMHEVDAVALQRAWQDHADARGDGLAGSGNWTPRPLAGEPACGAAR